MDDITFLNTILPSQGLRCIALVTPKGGWHHEWGTTNHWLARASKHIDTTRNVDVYYGCSSFLPQAQDKRRDHAGRLIGGRKQKHVAFVRSFWVDLDVGAGDPKKYPTQIAAAKAIAKFARDLGLPQPFIVNSGWGVHAYWPMDADMLVADWKPVAEALKRALRAGGVRFDPSRTADEASVLRPPGTHNYKRQPKMVRLVATGTVWKLDLMRATLAAWVQAPAAPIAPVQLSTQNSALGGGMGPSPSSALMMADKCGVMALMRDTQGNVDQPTWYYSLGVLLHTEEAPAICHEWSKGHPDYTAEETDANLARLAEHGATSCDKLGEHQSDICAACPFRGEITSPIQLGRPRVEKTTVETVERVVDKKGFVKETIVKIDLPYGYGETVRDGRRLLTHTTKTTDKDGKVDVQTDIIANTHFWGLTRMWLDNVSLYEFEMLTREGPRRFVIEGSIIAGGGRELSKALGANEIVAMPGKGQTMHNYMTYWLANLTKNSDQVRAHRSFGWGPDETFVLGDIVIKPDGSETRSVLMGMAKDKAGEVTRKGDLQTWVGLVDRAYNAPGQEAFQFQLGCAFAAPLLSLMQQVNGVTVYAHTEGSGVGKTTVQKVGLSAWGFADEMMLAHGKATVNAMWGLMGAYRSLPVVYDELTLAPAADVAEMVFSVSSGRAKERLDASGGLRTNNSNWSTILLASGNALLSEVLSGFRSNTEAEVSRLFEFTLEATPHLSVAEANALFPQFLNNYGHAGHAFARFITKNRAKVIKALHAEQARLIEKLGLTQVERHWSALFASVLVALHIARALKLVAFEIAPVETWIAERLEENRGQRKEAVADHADLLAQMIDDLWADVLVTKGLGDLRSNVPIEIQKHPRNGTALGRCVRPTANDIADLILSRNAIQKWCAQNRASPKTLYARGVAMGWVHPEIKRFCIGRGAKEYQTSDNVYCWRFFPDAMESPVAHVAAKLAIVKGGKP